MKKTIIFSILAIALVGTLNAAPQTVMVDISGFAFVPPAVTIMTGDTVKWTNMDDVGHTSTSGAPGMPDGHWDSGMLFNGQSFTHVFDSAGTFPYFCIPHNSMTGRVMVEERPDTSDTTDSIPVAVEETNFLPFELNVGRDYVEFSLSTSGNVEILLYDLTGTAISEINRGFFTAGQYRLALPETPPGVYFVRLTTGSSAISRKYVSIN